MDRSHRPNATFEDTIKIRQTAAADDGEAPAQGGGKRIEQPAPAGVGAYSVGGRFDGREGAVEVSEERHARWL
jgi:hypothetical protein